MTDDLKSRPSPKPVAQGDGCGNRPARAWAAWVAYRASFVFAEDLQGWPVVRHLGPDVCDDPRRS